TPSPGSGRRGRSPTRNRCRARSRRSASAWWTGGSGSTCPTRRTRGPRWTRTSSPPTPARSSRSKAPARAPRSPAARSTRCSTSRWPASAGSRTCRRRCSPSPTRASCLADREHVAVKVLLATRNADKLAELRRLLADGPVEVIGLAYVPEFPEAPETGATFAENALAKARDAAAATGLPSVADDSGLTVEALNGMPGVLSARWCGRHGDDRANLELLLGQLADVPDERRRAAFVCAAALVVPGGKETVVHGEWPGRIARAPRGTNGFGYDPIFIPDGEERTSAELSPEEKDAASHRGRAMRALLPHLRALA